MPKPIKIRVWGDYALFSRPELKAERYSYDIITPSAARGIYDAIYYHPGIRWQIKRIYVQKPIRFTNVRRNEVIKKILASDLMSAANGSGQLIYIDRAEAIAQRAATILRDVSYVIEANFNLIPEKMGEGDSADKFFAIFSNRLKSGKCFTQPYLGCREFPAYFEPFPSDCEPQTIPEDRDFGIMLYDMDYSEPESIKPTYFRAVMKKGVVDLRDCEVLR
jgi:CRISPR-associated protein Cas5 subtype I-C